MLRLNSKLDAKKDNRDSFLRKFKNKSGIMPTLGVSAFLGDPGRNQADKRDGVVALQRENKDAILSMTRAHDKRRQQLYEARDQIDHHALYNYFKDIEDVQQIGDPDDIKGPFRRKFFLSRDFPVVEQLAEAE